MSLRTLLVDRGPAVPNIEFLGKLTQLVDLGFTRTEILDGDISPVLNLVQLRELELGPYRKRYSPSRSELLDALLARRSMTTIRLE